LALPAAAGFAEYQVQAVDAAGIGSFLSEPLRREATGSVTLARPVGAPLEREHSGYSGAGYVRLTRGQNLRVELPLRLACGGEYLVDARYANGSGPVNTDSKAAIRTLRVDGREAGVLVMPQRGSGHWDEWGYGTPLRLTLAAGAHRLLLEYTALDENMDRHENTALLDHLRLTRLSSCR
jgi:hypothetical protein